MKPALPHNETERLQALHKLQILDTQTDPDFDALTKLAALICHTQTSVISLIDENRQWFKARLNLDELETPRATSFCAHAILQPEQLTYVPDAKLDARFANNPNVTKSNGIRFYAGAPLLIKPGLALGTLCVIDTVPRELTEAQQEALILLAKQAVSLMLNRKLHREKTLQQQTLFTITEHVPVLLGQIDQQQRYVFCNKKYDEWFGIDPITAIGSTIEDVFGSAVSEELAPALQRCYAGEQVEHTIHERFGRILNLCFVPQKSTDGTVEHVIIVANDITETHLHQQKMQQERDRLDAIIRGTNLGTWEWNIQTGQTIYNPRWYQMLGLQVEPHTSISTWESLVHPEDMASSKAALEQHFLGKTNFYDVKFRMRHTQGHWVWIHAVGRVTSWNNAGQPLMMFGTHTDISNDKEREAQMMANRSWLQAVVDSSTEVAMISTDTRGVIQLFNTGAERMLGYSASELIGKQSPALFHDVAEVQRRSAQLSQQHNVPISGFDTFVYNASRGVNETRQWTYICKNGERKQVRLSVSVMRNDEGVAWGYLGVAVDVTQLEQLNHALLLSEQRHRSMLENLPGVVYRCINDDNWTMLFISDEVEKLTGFPAKNFIRNKTTSFSQITLPEDTEQNRIVVERELALNNRFSVEYRIRHANGSVRWVQELGRGIFDQNNKLLYIDGFIWDVTAQKEAQLALRASEQKLLSLYQLAPLAIVLSRFADGTILDANPELYQMLGYEAQSLNHSCFADLTPASYNEQEQQQLLSMQQQGRYGPYEKELLHRDGHLVPVVQSGVLIESASGEKQTWSIIQDITEHKRIELMKNQFVSMVSHELRTPLTSISGALGLLNGGALGEVPTAMQNMLVIAQENSNKLSQLINDLLDIDKLVAGKMQFEFSACSMKELLQQSVLHNQPYADKYQASIELQADVDATVQLDPMRFHQIMANLLSNAAKFSPQGSLIKVRLNLTDVEVNVEILDQGPGISAEFQQRMFEKFSQADSADARNKDGTGLGLAIVKELTERMHGHISYRHTAETGSCFTLHFPILLAGSSLPKDAILVVDDDPAIAGYLRMLLESSGYLVSTAHSLASARRALSLRSFVAMTLDLNLPDGHASAFISELRGNTATAALPVLVISVEKQQDETRYTGFTAFDWLEKPVQADVLLQKIATLLHTGKPKLLHVEDDPSLTILLQQLTRQAATTMSAGSVEEAKHLLQQHQFDLIVLDLGLPDGSGWELLPFIAAKHQHLPVLVWSSAEVTEEQRQKVAAVLAKGQHAIPQLLSTIEQLLQPQTP
jgi:PAS domain S-box-containing protein